MSEERGELRVEVSERVATVTIDREHRRNALSRAVVSGLIEQLDVLGRDPGVGVIVITGAGEKAFCAGGDLSDQVMSEGALGMHHARGDFARLLVAMQACHKPLIGRVQGMALGGGFGVALNCDLVVASEAATFGTPEIKVGLFPMMIMAVIARNIGRKRAMEMMLTGARVSAQDALSWGIVNEVVAPEELDAAVARLAGRVAGFSPAVLRLGRKAFYDTQDMGFEQALAHLHSELTINALSEDTAEGISAFFAGRAPEWKGR